jgi:hypothetical protein
MVKYADCRCCSCIDFDLASESATLPKLRDTIINSTLDLSARDRVDLLCRLTCAHLGEYLLSAAWPGPAFNVQVAASWLNRHCRKADWLEVAQLSFIAQQVAQGHISNLDSASACRIIEAVLETKYQGVRPPLVESIHNSCKVTLAQKSNGV